MESKDLFHVEQRQYMWVVKTVKSLWLGQLGHQYLYFLKKLLYIEFNTFVAPEMFIFKIWILVTNTKQITQNINIIYVVLKDQYNCVHYWWGK